MNLESGCLYNFPEKPCKMWGRRANKQAEGRCGLTKVIVVHHGVGCPQPGPLLGKVVAKLQKRCVFLQHVHDLHFHFVAQGLALCFF